MSRQQYILLGILALLAIVAAYVYLPSRNPPEVGIPVVPPAAVARPSEEAIQQTVTTLKSLNVEPRIETVQRGFDGKNESKTTVYHVVFRPGAEINPKAIDELRGLPDLNSVSFYNTSFSDAHVNGLLSVKQLSSVNLNYTQVTDAGVAKLTEFSDLSKLSLNGTQITDAGLQELAKSRTLNYLALYETKITDAGLKHLPTFANLTMVDIQGTSVTPQGITALQQSLPDCRILFDPY